MIHLLDIEITDFMSIEHLQMEFSANETKIISGDNGAGKSALFNAVALVWIEYRKGDSYKDFIRTGCETAHIVHNALFDGEPIHFDITISNDKYATPLQRKVEYKGSTYVNSECSALFKTFDMDHLEHIMFLFQRDNSIVDLKAGERAKLLKKLFHFEFEAQVLELKARLASEQLTYHDSSVRLEELTARTFEEQEILPVAPESDRLAALKEMQNIDVKLAKLGEFDSSEFTTLQDALQDARAHIAKQENIVTQLRGEIKSLEAQQAELEALEIPNPPINAEEAPLVERVSTAMSAVTDLEHAISSLKTKVDEYQQQLTIALSGICHACGQTVTESAALAISTELDTCRAQYEQLLFRLPVAQHSYEVLRKELETCRAVNKRYENLVNNIQVRKAAGAGISELLAAKQTAVQTAADTIEALRRRETELTSKLPTFDKNREKIEERDQLIQDREELQAWLDEHARCKAINEERRAANQRLRQEQEQHASRVSALAQTITDTAASVETLKKAVTIFESEFPNFIILQTCGQIEGYINEVVQRIFPYMQVQLKPNRGGVEFYYTADNTTNIWLSVKMASGAQAAILSLAWRVAIARLYGVTTILLDEVDADCTDDNARLIYEFIASLDMFHQIVLISHRKEALRAIATLADNVTCYWVSAGGIYTEIADPDSI